TSKGSIPVIIISAKSEQQTKVKGLRSGADDFIAKPFDVEEVSARIDSLLRRYKRADVAPKGNRSEEHTSELQSRFDLVCRLLLRSPPISTLFPYTTLFRS